MKRRKAKVFCFGCANLFMVGGKQGKETPPMCIATAEFVEGPLRRKIDVFGVMSAERRNIKNDCVHRLCVSIRAWELKRWLLWRLNDGSKKRIEEIDPREYPVKKEYDRKKAILGGGQEDTAEETEKDCSEIQEEIEEESGFETEAEEESSSEVEEYEEEESVLADGGIDDHDESGTIDKGGSEDI